ncbi:tRNA (N6-threonylcarbamoyladenosine(37)-N6)-methyltransferase TrmO [Motiliproteus sp.]|uniref:tRNA (N6-threonylcarbamoyladenosine(37)-N6)-methyltransferase TrmO n=1 Tax=Motiliproteus sp. TaxID=1898955 RepID=UPI003BA98930
MSTVDMTPIGTLHSCFKEKFGIPRQPGLANTARAELRLENEFATMDAVRGLEQCSHVWVLFLFSEHLDRGWTPLVRPPRSGGGKVGVFATRSTFRPNPIGMSVVKLERIENRNGQPVLHLSGVDILDGTPVLDIKPYLPYADRLEQADYPYAPDGQKTTLDVVFSEQAQQQLSKDSAAAQLQQLIIDVLSCDPRPTHRRKRDDNRVYGTLLEQYNVRWQIQDSHIDVLSIDPATD